MNTNDNIEHIDPRVLKPHPKNSRKHGDSQITQLVASIEQFGFNAVITIDEDDVILAGHGRTLAAIRAGLETVPCLRRTGLTDDQKRAYVIADNKIGLNSEWDEDILAQEIADLTSTGFDLGSLGIDVAALESIADPAGRTAADVKALEEKTDSAAPADEPTFEKEMASKSDAGLLPIGLTSYINASAFGLLWSDKLYFTSRTTAAESHWINLLNAAMHRKCWTDTRFCFAQAPKSTFFRPGGQTAHRTLQTELEDTLFLRRMFGQAVQIKRVRGDASKVHPYQRTIINPL